MRSTTVSGSGNDTRAVSVARLTVAVTPSSLFSFFSNRAAHDAQVIPPMTRSVVLMTIQNECGSNLLVNPAGQPVVAGLVKRRDDRRGRERRVACHGDGGRAAGNQFHGHVADAVQVP